MNAIMSYLKPYFKQSIGQFRDKDALSIILSLITKLGICISLMTFGLVVGYILIKGFPHLDSRLFEWHYSTQNASMLPAIINTFTMIIFALILATPIGILGAIFLVQYAKSDSVIVAIISIAAETLVGIPSIIYGLFGYLAFVIYFGFGLSIISGALTLAIMILPLILRNTQESLKSVPQTYKEASFALGAGKLRTIFRVILPCAISGILAGVILAIGRIVGESAALLYTSRTVAKIASLNDSGRTLSVHMYALLSEGQYLTQAYATAVVLLIFVVIINFTSNFLVKKLSPLHIS